MSKKFMVLALAVVSAAFFALPAMASAQEIHLEPAEKFTVAGSGGELRGEGEPAITCTKTEGSGSYNAGSTTTGTATLDFTGCHTSVFGFTASCNTSGAASGTITSSGTFHLIKLPTSVTEGGVLLTTNPTTIICAGISNIAVTGNVIGTITSPKCGESSKVVTLSFTATGTVQNHMTYTGVKYDLLSKTGSGENKTSALVGTATNSQSSAGKLNCT
jgi:hypothetical protein